ncbi:hypothetical protein [Caulobacter sp. RHG1]|uniref:hypothetical protein n=1 Tax=Caulobacter sp. (strain RHG1) TaxID=2545762 RepID=UPI0015529A8E|nr:hypothetical protein [Caulobacter sp. RHG1]
MILIRCGDPRLALGVVARSTDLAVLGAKPLRHSHFDGSHEIPLAIFLITDI